jgi:hypothetical protein
VGVGIAGRPRNRISISCMEKDAIFSNALISVLASTQPSVYKVPGMLSQRIKRPGREADHSPLHLVSTLKMSAAIPLACTETIDFMPSRLIM